MIVAKQKSAIEALNAELSQISAAISVAKSFAAFADEKGEIGRLLEKASLACNASFHHLAEIRHLARSI